MSDGLAQFLSKEDLDPHFFYRAFRYDMNREVLKLSSLEDQLKFCSKEENIVKAFINTNKPLPGRFSGVPALYIDSGDFILFSKEKWRLLHGYPEINNLNVGGDPLLCYMAYLSGLEEKILQGQMRLYHIDHDSRWRISEGRATSFLRNRIYNNLETQNGLKILMKEVNMVKNGALSFFLDNFYLLFGFLIKKYGKPGVLDFNLRYLLLCQRRILFDMLSGKRSYVYNDGNWGLPNEKFEEYTIASDE
jgi:hypothetical protein